MSKEQNMVSQGVTLMAFGKPIFFEFAFNMALSLRKHSPNVPIQLIHDHYIKELGDRANIFDVLTDISSQAYTDNKRIQAGKGKLSMYSLLHFDETLYLDVDGVVLQDISPLFDQEQDFKIQKDAMHWVDDHDGVAKQYNLKKQAIGCNSSIMFVRKSKTTKKLFADALKAIDEPFENMATEWFHGMHPDELYLGISMSKNNLADVYFETRFPVYFQRRIDYHINKSVDDVKKDFFVLGCYGNHRYNHRFVYDLYQRENRSNWREIIGMSPRKDIHKLMRYKH